MRALVLSHRETSTLLEAIHHLWILSKIIIGNHWYAEVGVEITWVLWVRIQAWRRGQCGLCSPSQCPCPGTIELPIPVYICYVHWGRRQGAQHVLAQHTWCQNRPHRAWKISVKNRGARGPVWGGSNSSHVCWGVFWGVSVWVSLPGGGHTCPSVFWCRWIHRCQLCRQGYKVTNASGRSFNFIYMYSGCAIGVLR